MVRIMEIELKRGQLRINYKAREWCRLPYPDHPEGCPNYGNQKHFHCPPNAPLIRDFIDIERRVYLIIVEFDLLTHAMKYLAKGWSKRQARCCLYWQNTVNKQLDTKCQLFKWTHPDMITTRCPEGMGVNVITTAKLAGLPIKAKPKDIVYKIALAGYPVYVTRSYQNDKSL